MVQNIPGNIDPIAGIILAAGASRRMGVQKLLLDWKGKTLLEWVAQTATDAGLSPVIIVSGKDQIRIAQLPFSSEIILVNNPEWESGQSTSVKAGMNALPQEVSAVVIFLGDQPMITSASVEKLTTAYRSVFPRPKIVIPVVDGKRGNPVLFDRSVFNDLQILEGDKGARQLFDKFQPLYVEFSDPGLLIDIDSPEDYQNLVK